MIETQVQGLELDDLLAHGYQLHLAGLAGPEAAFDEDLTWDRVMRLLVECAINASGYPPPSS